MPRPTTQLLLNDAERERLAARGWMTVREFADFVGYSITAVHESVLAKSTVYHTRYTPAGKQRAIIRISRVDAERFRDEIIQPLRDQVVAPSRRGAAASPAA